MKRLLDVLVLLGICANTLLADSLLNEAPQIKGYSINLVTFVTSPDPNIIGGSIQLGTAVFFSTDQIIASDNPFPSLGDGVSYTHEQFYQILGTRFRDVSGVDGTMITDYYYGASFNGDPPPLLSTQRPFFYNIDSKALEGLSNWTWNGDGVPALVAYATPPAATGTFNQAEQRFYVSDGRQYQVVPEPSALSLLLAGGAVALAMRRKV